MSSTISNKLLKAAGIAAVITGGISLANELMTRHALSSDTPVIQEHYHEWSYGKIYYTRQGNGSPLLFIHGLYPAANGHPFKILADALSDHHTVYILDLPGYGLSDKPQLTYTSFFYAQMLNDFIENVIQSPTSVFAEDLSCTFCSIACQIAPRLYSKLILLNPPSHEEELRIPSIFNRFMRHILELPILGTFIYNLSVSGHALNAKYATVMDKDELLLSYARAHRKISGARYAFASLKNNYMNANISRALSKLDTSIYVVYTGNRNTVQKQMEHLHTVNSSIEAEYLYGSDHYCWLQDPTDILEIFHIFL